MIHKQKVITFIFIISVVVVSFFLISRQATQTNNQDTPQVLPMQSNDVTRQEVIITENDFKNVQKRTITIGNSIGSFVLRDADDSEYFILETIATNAYKPTIATKQNGTQLNIHIKVPGEGRNPHMMMGADQYSYRGTIGQVNIPTEMDFNLGAGDSKIGLTKVPLSNFTLSIGAGSADVFLDRGSVPPVASILVGTGSLVYTLPKDVGVEVAYKVATGSFIVAKKRLSGDGIYTSDNFNAAKKKVKINAVVGSGSIIFNYK